METPQFKQLIAVTTIAWCVLSAFPTHGSADEVYEVVPGLWKFLISERASAKGPAHSQKRRSHPRSMVLNVCFASDESWHSPDSSKRGSWDVIDRDVMMHGNYIADGYQGGGNITAKLTLLNKRLMKGTWASWSDSHKEPLRAKFAVAKKVANSCDREVPLPDTSDKVIPGVSDKDVDDLPQWEPWQPGDPVREVPKGVPQKSQ